MKKAIKSLIKFCCALALFIGTAFAFPLLHDDSTSRLFVIHARSGCVVENNDMYILQLKNPTVSYFTDRPIRTAGSLTAQDFITNWTQGGSNSFAKVNPNAALIADFTILGGSNREHFIILSSSSYNATTNTMSLGIQTFPMQDTLKQGKFSDVVLFVDGSSCAQYPGNPNCW